MRKQASKKGYGLWILGAVLLLLSLGCYVPVSLGLAKGYLLAAGQVAGLAAGAVYLLFFKKTEELLPEKEQKKKERGKRAADKKETSFLSSLKTTLSGAGYICCWVCFFLLLSQPLQNILAGFGLASLNECAHHESLWEMILYVLILPPVCLEVLHRLILLPLIEARFEKRWQVLLVSALFYTFSAPQIGNVLARFALGLLLSLLFLRTRSFVASFCGALVGQFVLFLAGYMQILGFAGAEAYTFLQCLGMGMTFGAPGAVILYFNEKIARKGRIRVAELLVLFGCAAFAFALGMALWLDL